MLPTMVLLITFTLYPLVQGLLMAFFKRGVVVVPQVPNTLPQYVGLENFIGLLSNGDFQNSLLKTVLFVVIAVPLNIVVSLSLALLLAPQTKLFAVVRTVVFFPSMISLLIIGVAWRWLVRSKQRPGQLPALTGWHRSDPMAGAGHDGSSGDGHSLGVGASRLQHDDLYRRPDRNFQRLLRGSVNRWHQQVAAVHTHYLPLLKPTLAVVLVLSSIEAFKVYELVVSLTGGGPGKATVYLIQTIYDTAFQKPMQAGVAAAQSMVLFIILLFLTVFQLRVSRGEK